ncbi:hypothetical protein NC981_24575 [Leptolyngbya sp. DQ-M1]|uniref:hypothetical protein n=1 Tax=Leptolyngbya sp. DQ-M1 TaxID=2933920 RepID=UPI00329A701A
MFPVINPADIADLNDYERRQFWLAHQNRLKQIRSDYYKFIEDFSESTSPSTRANKDTAIINYIKFKYRMFVSDKKDYDANPLIQTMRTGLNLQMQEKHRRQKHRQTEADESLKFPDPVEGKTDLEVMRETVLMPTFILRRPRLWQEFRQPLARFDLGMLGLLVKSRSQNISPPSVRRLFH